MSRNRSATLAIIFKGKIAPPNRTVHRGAQAAGDAVAEQQTSPITPPSSVAELRPWEPQLQRNEQQQADEVEKGSHCYWPNRNWPSGALAVIEMTALASHEPPREAGSRQQWPCPTNCLQTNSQPFAGH